MSVVLAFSFPLGVYHGSPWHVPANAGESEWPPSPWRLLRALLSTWHTRRPELDETEVDSLVTALAAELPEFLVPHGVPSQTRHYMPQTPYLSGHDLKQSLTIDGRLHIDPSEYLIVRWQGVELSARHREVLASLVSLVPYLGRSESVCDGALVDNQWVAERCLGAEEPASWTRPTPTGQQILLCPDTDISLAQLQVSPDEVRKAKLARPSGTTPVAYALVAPRTVEKRLVAKNQHPTAARWALMSSAPFSMRFGVLAADALRTRVLYRRHDPITSVEGALLTGHLPAKEAEHRHTHWLFLPDPNSPTRIGDLVAWCPAGFPNDVLDRLTGVRSLLDSERLDWVPRGYVSSDLQLTGLGRAEHLMPDYVGRSTLWETVTPVTSSRHPKKNWSDETYWERALRAELKHRPQFAGIDVVGVELQSHDRAREFRRYRWKETMADRRYGALLRAEFSEPITGPVVLGALAHFGLGLMKPV